MIKRLRIQDYAAYLSKLGPRMQKAIDVGMQSGGERAIFILQRATDAAKAVSGSNPGYRASWKFRRIPNGITVYNQASYAGVIEYGRRPGKRMPPSDVIARWAQRKMKIPYKQAKKIAFGIALNIARKGIAGKHVMGFSRDKIAKAILEEIERELKAALGGK